MSLIINKINKGNKGGMFLRLIRVLFLLVIVFGPIASASLFDLSDCGGISRWYWIGAFCVLFFISFEIVESRHDKKGRYILTNSFLLGLLWQAVLFIPFILITRPEATQTWNCARSIAVAAALTCAFFLIEFVESKVFDKKR